MLTRLYRYGPARQRVLKGFVVRGADAPRIVSTLVRDGLATDAPGLISDRTEPCSIWIDSGPCWLHTERARSSVMSRLGDAAVALSERVAAHGGELLPAALSPEPSGAWRPYVCADRHFLETVDLVEKEVCCNLLREHLPVLVAMTGRAGVRPWGVEEIGSRRLCDSGHHFAARYLASVSAVHLQRVRKALRRDEGVPYLELLDVNPVGEAALDGRPWEAAGAVEVRFVDAQTYWATVRAHAILLCALTIRARRMVREGRRVGNVPQAVLERNRARAIAAGLQATLEDDRAARRRGGRDGERRARRPVSDVARELLNDLAFEFQVLEVEWRELAPLVLGLSLRQIGLPGLQGENELLRALARRRNPGDLFTRVASSVRQTPAAQGEPCREENTRRFPAESKLVERWWDQQLRSARPVTLNAGARDPGESRPSQAAPPSRPSSRPAGTAPVKAGSPSAGVTALLDALRCETPPSDQVRLQALRLFRSTGSTDVNRSLAALDVDTARDVRQRLRPAREQCFVERRIDAAWDQGVTENAARAGGAKGLAYLTLEQPLEEEDRTADVVRRLESTVPAGLVVFRIARRKLTKQTPHRLQIDLMIVHQGAMQ